MLLQVDNSLFSRRLIFLKVQSKPRTCLGLQRRELSLFA